MEKWLKSRPNPYANNRIGFKGSRFGKPAKLFKDSDKDGVANVFDCKPYNKRKQDVIMPFSGSNPMQEMHTRQENTRLNAVYQRQVAALQKQLEDERTKVATYESGWVGGESPSGPSGWGESDFIKAGYTKNKRVVGSDLPSSSGGSFVISKNPVMSIPSSIPKSSTSSAKSSITGGVISTPSKSTTSAPYAYINVPGGQSRAASPISSPSKGSSGSRK
jgi:hypothetical protein